MRHAGTAAKQVSRQANYTVTLEQIAGGGQPSSTPPPTVASSAGDDRMSALLAGAGPQPTEGGPQKRKAS
eukprot:2349025-Alexandrium_andersonii.AAC.1